MGVVALHLFLRIRLVRPDHLPRCCAREMNVLEICSAKIRGSRVKQFLLLRVNGVRMGVVAHKVLPLTPLVRPDHPPRCCARAVNASEICSAKIRGSRVKQFLLLRVNGA